MLMILISLSIVVYSAFLCLLILRLRKRYEIADQGDGTTKVSIVVACKNEEKNIAILLDTLLNQNYPSENLEIIIVDDSSTDKTVSVTNEFIRQHAGNTRLVSNCASGKKSAIFTGVKESTGDLIIVTDADCCVGPAWVASYEQVFLEEHPDMIAGRVISGMGSTFVSAFGKYEFAALQGVTEAMVSNGNPVMCNGANMAFLREQYIRHADHLRMDIESGDDMFLLHAVKNDGGKICWNHNPESAVRTNGAGTLAGLLRQRARWASKATQYTDTSTILTAIIVFMANIAALLFYSGSLFSASYLYMLPVAFALKAIPDGIIINHVLIKEKEKFSLLLFLIMDILYPFYIISVFVLSLFPSMKKFSGR
jgi:poly-beta-1,6-N-acetyl-D-glucosamine synthase